MADIRLGDPAWFYNEDDTRKPMLKAVFVQAVTTAGERPSMRLTVEMPLGKLATKENIVYPPEPPPSPVPEPPDPGPGPEPPEPLPTPVPEPPA